MVSGSSVNVINTLSKLFNVDEIPTICEINLVFEKPFIQLSEKFYSPFLVNQQIVERILGLRFVVVSGMELIPRNHNVLL